MSGPGGYERDRARAARRYGEWAISAIRDAASPTNRFPGLSVDSAYHHARAAADEARLSLQAREARLASREVRLGDAAALGDRFETWNTCPDCGASWKDATPTPGLLHRTRLCGECALQTEARR